MTKNIQKSIKLTANLLDHWLPYKILYDNIPSISVGITFNGKLIYKKAFGFADLETKKKTTSKTCFRIASISKTFTAIAIFQLIESGKIALDDKVQKYLPWFNAKNKNYDSKNITIRQLLSHTAGIFRDGDTPHWINGNFPDENTLKNSISSKTIVFENLTHFKYSNFGYAILGQVIKKITGSNYNKYVKENIIAKLSLKLTEPDINRQIINSLASGYSPVIPDRERIVFEHIDIRSIVHEQML